jgi:hypothetical protein
MLKFKRNALASDTYTIFGWILASLSLISFIQRIWSVGLGAMANCFVGYYRTLAHAVFGAPVELLGITLPSSLIDFWALAFVCAGAYARAENIEDARAFRHLQLKKPSIKLRAAVFLIFGFTGLSLFIPLSAISIQTYTDGDITRDALKNLLVILAVVFGFFILNAFSPSA